MQIIKYSSVEDFFDDNLAFLEREEAVNNLLIGIPRSMASGTVTPANINLLSAKDKDGVVVFSLVQTPPLNYLIYADENISQLVLQAIIKELAPLKFRASGIIGPEKLALKFAEQWQQMTGFKWHIHFRQFVYQLDALQGIPLSKGQIRKANQQDYEMLVQWFTAFEREAMGNEAATVNREAILMKILQGAIFIWEEETPVSMAAVARPTRHGIAINYVYTPKAYRGKGYASSCVYRLSERMLQNYQFCCLFTDRTNPTSNKIYRRMGYYPIAKSLEIKFVE